MLVIILVSVKQVIQRLAAFDSFRVSQSVLAGFPVHKHSPAENPIFQNILRHIHIHFASVFV